MLNKNRQRRQERRERRGLMLVLSSPSGAGKSTMSRKLLAQNPDMTLSVSATTRKPRSSEKNGVDYYFVSKDEFSEMIENDKFLEYAKVFDHYYGTPKQPVEAALALGHDVLFDIDWQGAQQLAQAAGDDLVRVFILPPSKRELEKRLRNRAQDSEAVIARRMSKSEAEMSHWAEYDYVIVNDDIDEAMSELEIILQAERNKRKRQLWLGPFVKALMQQ